MVAKVLVFVKPFLFGYDIGVARYADDRAFPDLVFFKDLPAIM